MRGPQVSLFLCLVATSIVQLASAAIIKRHAEDAGPMYIVGYSPDISAQDFEARTQALTSQVFGIRGASEELQPIDASIGNFKAVCSYLTPEVKAELEKDSNVLWVEERIEMKAFATVPVEAALYNLDILDGTMDGQLTFPDNAGQGVNVYVIDTGIVAEHTEFSGRAKLAGNFAAKSKAGDVQGHGTHVAGTVGGMTTGIAKNANIMAVKVLGDDGSGSNVGVVRGIQFAVQDAQQSGRPCVINMSLGGPASNAVDQAVRAANQGGCVVVVAAGNEAQDACNVSPSREPSAITVAASNVTNTLARFSNFGSCVDVIAPGVQIVSASNRNNQGVRPLSGTSMASPLVAGVVAVMMSQGFTAAQIPDLLTSQSISNMITGNLRGTPNALVSLAALNAQLAGSQPQQPVPAPVDNQTPAPAPADPAAGGEAQQPANTRVIVSDGKIVTVPK